MNIETDAEYIVFVSSSGHCSLDCTYCIVNPIVKHQPTLSFEDIEYFLDKVQKKTALIFSGKGDYFAGYKKNEKQLARLLERNVEIALDINGVMIHEFAELTEQQLKKIRHINLTMHYRQLIDKNALEVWKKNALILIDKKGHDDNFMLGTILSPPENHLWEEALSFFEQAIFEPVGQKIVLIKDVNNPFNAVNEAKVSALQAAFSHLITEVREEDFASRFKNHSHVLCPAGKTYFRIWNDGSVQGCPYIPALNDCGNIKARRLEPRENLFRCSEAKYCDCYTIATLGKMVFESPLQQ
jgi:MoaA/NifB/PqqE/SkfB family radical SAM enzyme